MTSVVDIERVRPAFGGLAIAERFFAPEEVAVLRGLPDDARRLAFFHGWTRKEAYIKAKGKGLALPLDEFEVAIDPARPAALLGTRGDPPEASRWSLVELSADPGYVAALCVEGGRLGLAAGDVADGCRSDRRTPSPRWSPRYDGARSVENHIAEVPSKGWSDHHVIEL